MVTNEGRSGPATLTELQRRHTEQPAWLASLVRPEINGGTLLPQHMDELDRMHDATALRVSGLDQATFEHLVSRHGSRFSAIHFWKCSRLTDLSPLEDLPNLELVAYYWNQRATRLWDFTRTPRLRGLSFEDFTKIDVLDDLAAATSLRELVFGNVIDRKSTYATLDPVAGLTDLRRLEFTPRKILDRRIDPIGALTNLDEVNCPTNLFTSRQLAWLSARLPRAGASRVLQPVVHLGRPIGDNDVLLVGRGKPFLNSATDRDRIAKHVAQFERDVARYAANPDLSPD